MSIFHQHELHLGRDSGLFHHGWVLSTQDSALHRVGAQQGFGQGIPSTLGNPVLSARDLLSG